MNKIVLITGTSRGLGLCLAKHFIDNGWNVIGLSRSESPLKLDNYQHYKIDITDHKSLERELSNINHIDVVINNSASFIMKSFENTPNDVINDIIDTNLKGSIFVSKYALRFMKSGGKIIFVNSVAGLNYLDNQSIYCASKHGLRAFAETLGKELRTQNIKVSSIYPGGINTTLWNKDNPYPLGDVYKAIDPQEVTDMIYFISNSNSNVQYKSITMFPDIECH